MMILMTKMMMMILMTKINMVMMILANPFIAARWRGVCCPLKSPTLNTNHQQTLKNSSASITIHNLHVSHLSFCALL